MPAGGRPGGRWWWCCRTAGSRGDPALLGQELERLRRLAHRLIWVNPLSASDRFQPLTAGMASAMPHLDAFLSGHSLDALNDLVEAIGVEARS